MATSNTRMIVVPYKRTFEINITGPIKEFINNAYPTNNEEFKLSVDSLNQLRTDALFRSVRHEKLNKMMRFLVFFALAFKAFKRYILE